MPRSREFRPDRYKDLLDDIGPETCVNTEFSTLLSDYHDYLEAATKNIDTNTTGWETAEVAVDIAYASFGMMSDLTNVFVKCMGKGPGAGPPPAVISAVNKVVQAHGSLNTAAAKAKVVGVWGSIAGAVTQSLRYAVKIARTPGFWDEVGSVAEGAAEVALACA